MTLKEDIENQYKALLILAKEHDSCFKLKSTKSAWGETQEVSLKKDATERYWEVREKLESGFTEWMQLLRKSIDTIPSDERRFRRESHTTEFGDTFYTIDYDNKNFSSLMGFFMAIEANVEGDRGILGKITNRKPIYSQLRDLRGRVLSFSRSLDLFIPEKMVSIEQQVEIIFRLRELDMETAAEEIEGIDSEEDNRKKCLKARTALEQIVASYCEKQSVTPKGFYYNLDQAIEKGLTEKKQRKTIAAHYSFVSKIVHKEIEDSSRNTQFAVNGIFNIISSLIQR